MHVAARGVEAAAARRDVPTAHTTKAARMRWPVARGAAFVVTGERARGAAPIQVPLPGRLHSDSPQPLPFAFAPGGIVFTPRARAFCRRISGPEGDTSWRPGLYARVLR
jgi:hypothetical protein